MDNLNNIIEFAPLVILVFAFFMAYRVFVTPAQMSEKFNAFEQHLEQKFVLQQTNEVTINEIKNDIAEIKDKFEKFDEKLDSIILMIKG